MSLRCIYHAISPVDAHLLRHALEAEQIPVFVLGEALLGAVGEVPASGFLQVCVPQAALPQAYRIVQQLAEQGRGIDVNAVPEDARLHIGASTHGSLPGLA